MKSLICPVSAERLDENNVRVTGLLIGLSLLITLTLNTISLLVIVVLDYFIRAFTKWPYGPISWLAVQVVRKTSWSIKLIDKAPKIFAARVGFLFSIVGLVLYFIHPLYSQLVLLVLCGFAFLESIGNVCMGCLIYSHVVLRFYKP